MLYFFLVLNLIIHKALGQNREPGKQGDNATKEAMGIDRGAGRTD